MGGNQPMGGQPGGAGEQIAKGGQGASGENQPMGGDSQGGKVAGQTAGGGGRDPKGANATAEMYKDVWGHLPEKMRQEMDSYFKERFMPRYNDLLKQYYSNIAEQNKTLTRMCDPPCTTGDTWTMRPAACKVNQGR